MNATSTPENDRAATPTDASGTVNQTATPTFVSTVVDIELQALWDHATPDQQDSIRELVRSVTDGKIDAVEAARQSGYDAGYVDGQTVVLEGVMRSLTYEALRFAPTNLARHLAQGAHPHG